MKLSIFKILLRHTRLHACTECFIILCTFSYGSKDMIQQSQEEKIFNFIKSCFKLNLDRNAESHIIFSIYLIQYCKILNVYGKKIEYYPMSSCIYCFPSYYFYGIQFRISTAVLKTNSKIVNIYLKDVFQCKEKKSELTFK